MPVKALAHHVEQIEFVGGDEVLTHDLGNRIPKCRVVFGNHLAQQEDPINLEQIGIALGGRGEDASDIQWLEVGIGRLLFRLNGGKQAVVFDGVIDGGGGEKGIEAALAGGGS